MASRSRGFVPEVNPLWITIIASLLAVASARAADGPHINRAYPSALTPGEGVEVSFFGERLDRVTNLWTSFPCTFSQSKVSASEAVYGITVPSNVPVQIGVVRLAGTNAISDLHLLMIDDLPTIRKGNARK